MQKNSFAIEFFALKLADVFLKSGSFAKIQKMPNFGSKNCKKFTFFKCNFRQSFANWTLSWGYSKPPCKISALSALRFGQFSAHGANAASLGTPFSCYRLFCVISFCWFHEKFQRSELPDRTNVSQNIVIFDVFTNFLANFKYSQSGNTALC